MYGNFSMGYMSASLRGLCNMGYSEMILTQAETSPSMSMQWLH